MILVLENKIAQNQKDKILNYLSDQGCITREIMDAGRNVIGVIGKSNISLEEFKQMDGVADALPIKTSYKLVSRDFKSEDTKVKIGNVVVGADRIVIIAGPCAVESYDQAMTIAKEVKKYGAVLFRGGAYKPRSSPYSFQGLEEEGLKILAAVRDETGLGVVTEITSVSQADLMMKYVDVVQIGARNMQNFELLKCVGRMGKPVVLKRGLASTIQEWLMSAEYIMAEGNNDVILCERGIRTFEPYTRNTLDLSAIPVLKKLTHLPIIIDPSHATGIREKVSPMARAAIAAGADALMIEVHNNPDQALSDGPQSLYPEQFGQLTRDIYVIAPVVGKQLDFDYLKKSEIINNSQTSDSKTAAFIGEYGAYSHKASLGYFGEEIKPVPMKTFKDIFQAVQTGICQYGVVPLENSLSGSIHENFDLLQEYDLKIIGEITIRVKHALIAHENVSKKQIKKILAPPPAFSQCKNYLDQYPDIELVPVTATSSAVRQIKDSGDKTLAAIGSTMAADIFHMTVIEESIEDNPRNYTRFAIIAKEVKGNKKVNKTSIIFSTGNKPGALFEVMKVFSEYQINLVKLESRPMLGKPWEYMFYADLEADIEAPELAPVMEKLIDKSENLRILGRY
ncbi:MAG: 3-deoxy-7-phosphoheptulonate synthase [Proteobacteria bacterium]|nr:3-deoxy-7-phosphoheptulonate synthase [Pseudomonadota bacterium]MBU1585004.1 3-deoxy-7-phosphoheptulonate synthase [Pseudomonadota bacterium]MBU2453934.1 3-deoxy-7-phosphoheptulonate synthase [Pseudomonadota bacterium]MBU2630313.1 3-deoxy-7-phosphoheptulonate synthase [Pseudomonadota bacterium]